MISDGIAQPHPLTVSERPAFETLVNPVTVVDLFSGCGGLSLGVAQAAHDLERGLDVRLAVEFDQSPADVYRSNFPKARAVTVADITTLFSAELDKPLSEIEKELRSSVGKLDVLVGGPPCQGHSNLNNHTRREDPKNGLYVTMARAAFVFSPDVIVVENVPAVLNDKYKGMNAVAVVRGRLKALGYEVDDRIVPLHELGVPQTRKRHILLATRAGMKKPGEIFEQLATGIMPTVDLAWAIGDLAKTVSEGLFDRAPTPSADNIKRMQYLLAEGEYDLPNRLRPKCHQGEHSYKSMYGRLKWSQPAQTITSGFGSIGQGRYMHPDLPRALTPHEAARIQGFPDYFVFSKATTRTALATMIGNAVPPQLARRLLLEILQPARDLESQQRIQGASRQ
ncbi:DNA cytosine methyltransferase [Microbacterium sp. NPDC087591]|uniref:DNA cytosine methyltransferase n=1 Tax=Microbacterium sp. NPDC087591 TaxID=3364192 RepID=UPI00382CC1D2